MDAILKRSHEEYWLEQGWLLALGFYEGWVCFRVAHKEWSRLKPFSLGEVTALSKLTTASEIMDSESRRYLNPHTEDLIYHTFWGVTPPRARIFLEYPPRAPLGSMLGIARAGTGEVGYIDGEVSPFNGPFSLDTEIFTIKEKYPSVDCYNPLNDDMNNVMLNFAQRHYSFTVIQNKDLIRDMLIGNRRVKKFTMGTAYPNAMTLPDWLKKKVGTYMKSGRGESLLDYSKEVMEEGGSS